MRFVLGSCVALAASVLMLSCGLAQDKPNPKQAFLSEKEAGSDFDLQGEYLGKIGDQTFGAQVIARGSGKFDGVIYLNGLPGLGWDAVKKEKFKVSGETKEGKTALIGGDFQASIIPGEFTLKKGDQTGVLNKLHRDSRTLGKRPPEGATVLFDGKDVEQWNPGKLMEANLMGVGTRTKDVFENYELHLEFRTPFMPYATGQARGNSGMYLGDQYECQVLDSFGLEGADNECGGIYSNSKPLLNMCFPPLSWQTYDVEFTCAKFDSDGNVTAPAKVTMLHNGVVIHKDLELKVTPGGGRKDQKPGALYLQDHGDPVRFQNIWILKK